MSLARGALLAAAVAVGSIVLEQPAAADGGDADTKRACVAASTEGQSLRDGGKLRAARETLVTCARDACPVIVRKYCAEWLADVESRIPTAAFRAQSPDGSDAAAARVSVDGGPARPADGTASPLDPGDHLVRFESDGETPVEMHVVLAEGERGRLVSARFPAKSAPVESPQPAPQEEGPRGIPAWAFVLGGVGVAGLAGFTALGMSAKSDVDNLKQTCAPNCASSDVDSARQKALFADLSLGVGVVALGAAAWVYLASRRDSAPAAPAAARLDVGPLPGGGFARLAGRF